MKFIKKNSLKTSLIFQDSLKTHDIKGVKKTSILAISICAVLCGARGYSAIAQWAQHRTQNQLKRLWCRYNEKSNLYQPPGEPIIRQVLQAIDAEAVDQAIYACG